MWRFLIVGAAILGVVVLGFSLVDVSSGGDVQASVDLLSSPPDISGFARADAPYDWQFPADHGPHPDFQTEWWYYTGNLADETGRRFGYQFTVFRRAIAPAAAESASEWRTNQVYMAHFTVTDVAAETFHQHQRFSRGGADLAGASVEPVYRVWLEDWAVEALDADALRTRITAQADDVRLELDLEQVKPPALQGDRGLSPKNAELGNASYYYSLSRLLTEGTLVFDGQTLAVSGTSWMDHEFSTSALGSDAQGWDWFGLHLDDNRELMLGRIRLLGGGFEPVFGGLLVLPDGSTQKLASDDFVLTVTNTWSSPHTGAEYPAGWQIRITPDGYEPFELTLEPLLADQELHEGIAYWEGAVRISGDASGYGYAELTGYAGTMNGRF